MKKTLIFLFLFVNTCQPGSNYAGLFQAAAARSYPSNPIFVPVTVPLTNPVANTGSNSTFYAGVALGAVALLGVTQLRRVPLIGRAINWLLPEVQKSEIIVIGKDIESLKSHIIELKGDVGTIKLQLSELKNIPQLISILTELSNKAAASKQLLDDESATRRDYNQSLMQCYKDLSQQQTRLQEYLVKQEGLSQANQQILTTQSTLMTSINTALAGTGMMIQQLKEKLDLEEQKRNIWFEKIDNAIVESKASVSRSQEAYQNVLKLMQHKPTQATS